MNRTWLRILLVFILFLILIQPTSARSPYDTDLSILSYDLTVHPNFDANEVAVAARLHIKNESAAAVDSIEIALCTFTDTDDLLLDLEIIQLIDHHPKALHFVRKNKINRQTHSSAGSKGKPIIWVHLDRPLAPRKSIRIELSYRIKGKRPDQCLPICKSSDKEVYLLSDFQWLPMIYAPMNPANFPNIRKPEWKMRVRYPKGYTAISEGRLKKRTEQDNGIVEEWHSIIKGWPQLFIGRYDVMKKEKDDLTVALYYPQGDPISDKASDMVYYSLNVLRFYSEIFGAPPSHHFNLIATRTEEGSHSMYMGAVIELSDFNNDDYSVLAHECAHTWWGNWITSYGVGTKFLRESLANFSMILCEEKLFNPEHAQHLLHFYKLMTFCNAYLANQNGDRDGPVVMTENSDPQQVIGASYRKGPLVLYAVKNELGDDIFFRALRKFVRDFHDQTASIEDFVRSFSAATKNDLRPFFDNFLQEKGCPEYRVLDMKSTPKSPNFITQVTVYNNGPFGLRCPVVLHSDTRKYWKEIKVDGGDTMVIRFVTPDRIKELVLDPEGTSYHRRENESLKIWESLDERHFQGQNWLWFNKAFYYYLMGQKESALNTLNAFLNQLLLNPKTASLEKLAESPLWASYLFTRAFYEWSLNKSAEAERDLRLSLPQLFNALEDENILQHFYHVGLLKKRGDKEQVLFMLSQMTGRTFDLPDDPDTQREKIKIWKQWWREEGPSVRLQLDMLKYYPVTT